MVNGNIHTTARQTALCVTIDTTTSPKLSTVDPLQSSISGAKKADKQVDGSFLQSSTNL